MKSKKQDIEITPGEKHSEVFKDASIKEDDILLFVTEKKEIQKRSEANNGKGEIDINDKGFSVNLTGGDTDLQDGAAYKCFRKTGSVYAEIFQGSIKHLTTKDTKNTK